MTTPEQLADIKRRILAELESMPDGDEKTQKLRAYEGLLKLVGVSEDEACE